MPAGCRHKRTPLALFLKSLVAVAPNIRASVALHNMGQTLQMTRL